MQLPGQSGKLDAVHFGHGNIGDDQGESLTFLSEFCQTLDAVDPEDDLIACSLENGSCNFSQRLLILNINNGENNAAFLIDIASNASTQGFHQVS